MKKKIALEGIISMLILLYLYTGLTQFLSYKFFHGNIYNQPVFEWSKPILVFAIPGSQLLVALGLVFERTKKAALWASLGLLLMFSVYIILIISHLLSRVPCTCGGVISSFTWPQHLAFNLFFVALNIIALMIYKRNTNQEEPVRIVAI